MSITLSSYYGLTPDYYIAPTGDDSTGTGTSANPWATLSHAITNSSAGETIGLQDGTYTYAVGDFDMDADRTFVGQSLNGVDIDFTAYSGNPNGFLTFGASGVEVEIINIRIHGISTATSSSNYSVFIMSSGTSGLVHFKNCIFHDIVVAGDSTGRKGYIFGLTGLVYGPVRMQTTNCMMYDLKAVDNSTAFANVFHSAHLTTSDVLYFKNIGLTFIHTGTGTSALDGLWAGSFADWSDAGEIINTNCIFADLTGLGIDLLESGENMSDTDYNTYYGFSNTGTLGANDVTTDPNLIDPEFASLTDPDDILLAFRPQTLSDAVGGATAV